MRFHITLNSDKRKHTDVVACVGWASPEEVITIGDDLQIISWNSITNIGTNLGNLPANSYAIDLHCYPPAISSNKRAGGGSGNFVIACANGKLALLNKNGRIEKSVDAHQGAVLCARWSLDGNALATGGEDGQIKIWSKTGMLRSTLVQTSKAVYCLSWNPDSSSIIYTFGKALVIKSLHPINKPLQWGAHEGLVLKTTWNSNTNLILSGGEDCKYKIWDSYGKLIYSSPIQEHPITSISWTPSGDLFAVGSFNFLRLCDKAGWSYCLEKPQIGSVYGLSWCCDGTQLAVTSSTGNVLFAHIIKRKVEWKNLDVELTESQSILVRDVESDTWEKLELPNRVLNMSLSHNFLIVTTLTQCFIYSVKNWNTPIVFDLRDNEGVKCIIQTNKYFLAVESVGVGIYSYDGRLVSNPKWPGMHPDLLNENLISLSNHAIAIRCQNDFKTIYVMDVINGKSLIDGKPIVHDHEIQMVALDQNVSSQDQMVAYIDTNGDLYLVLVKKLQNLNKRPVKIAVMVQSIFWNEDTSMLAVLQDGKLTVWYWPYISFVDPNMLRYTNIEIELSHQSLNQQIENFIGNQMNVRRSDGSLIYVVIPPFAGILHKNVAANKWDEATRLCRKLKEKALWACLAGMSLNSKVISTAEIAYAALGEVDKLEMVHKLSQSKLREIPSAEVSLISGNIPEAEAILIRGGLMFRAIIFNIELNRWDRALELATKQNNHVDVVLAYRQLYLNQLESEETKNNFIEIFKKESYDLDKVRAKMTEEFGQNLPIPL